MFDRFKACDQLMLWERGTQIEAGSKMTQQEQERAIESKKEGVPTYGKACVQNMHKIGEGTNMCMGGLSKTTNK